MIYTALNTKELLGVLDRASSFSDTEKNKVLAAAAIKIEKLLTSQELNELNQDTVIRGLENVVEKIQELVNELD